MTSDTEAIDISEKPSIVAIEMETLNVVVAVAAFPGVPDCMQRSPHCLGRSLSIRTTDWQALDLSAPISELKGLGMFWRLGHPQ